MKTYACSDLHGCLNFYKAIKESLEPEDKVYFLGDAGDRGPQSWETLDAILNDPQFIFIKGNHEDMLEKALFDYVKFGKEELIWSDNFNLLVSNGGKSTFAGARKAGNVPALIRKLRELPTHAIYVNKIGEAVCLSHAGFTLYENDEIPNNEDLLWDRYHCWDWCNWWPEENPNDYVVHGHTPTRSSTFKNLLYGAPEQYKLNDSATVIRYAHGHKIGIDAGAFSTNQVAILDLDTLQDLTIEIAE
jgi:hypothetical protein